MSEWRKVDSGTIGTEQPVDSYDIYKKDDHVLEVTMSVVGNATVAYHCLLVMHFKHPTKQQSCNINWLCCDECCKDDIDNHDSRKWADRMIRERGQVLNSAPAPPIP